MSAPNKPTDIEKKSNNAENVEMFFTTTEYVLVKGKWRTSNAGKINRESTPKKFH